MTRPQRDESHGVTRRQFAAASSTLAAAAAIGPQAHAAGDETIRLALIGCGGRGTGAIADAMSASSAPVKLHAMADVFENRLTLSHKSLTTRFKDRIDAPADRQFIGFDGFRKAIDTLKAGDVAVLTTPAAFRPQHFEYAVNRGVNVFMEKSFAPDSPGTRRVLKAAEVSEQKGLKVGVGFMWRHSQARQEAIARIHDGAIGEVNLLRVYRVHGPVRCPRLPKDANETMFQIQRHAVFPWASSGFFIDWHCHNIDIACWVKNAWPVRAQAMGGRCYEIAGPQFDHYCVEYTFPDGAKLMTFSRGMDGCWNTYSDYAHGSKGSAQLMAELGQPMPKIYKSQDMTPENVAWEFGKNDPNPYVAEWRVLLDAIRSNTPHNESRRAAEANFTALMGRMAAHTGQYVTREQAVASEFRYVADPDALTFDSPPPVKADANGLYAPPLPGVTKEI